MTPYCRTELEALQTIYADVKSSGGELVVFSAETTAITKGMADKQKLKFPIVRDTDFDIARSFGLLFTLPDDLKAAYQSFGLDLPKNTGYAAWELPVPSRFVVDRAGIVRAVDADPDYTVRSEPETTLAMLRHIA